MSSDDIESFEDRIKKAKQKREALVNDRAQKMAVLQAAKDKKEKLRKKAEDRGIDLDELENIIAEKKKILNGKIAVFEEALSEVEDELSKYDN